MKTTLAPLALIYYEPAPKSNKGLFNGRKYSLSTKANSFTKKYHTSTGDRRAKTNHEPLRFCKKRAARKLVGVLSRLRLKAPQPEMPLRLLQSPMPFFHELQRVRQVTTS
jgi:hypothetical protein